MRNAALHLTLLLLAGATVACAKSSGTDSTAAAQAVVPGALTLTPSSYTVALGSSLTITVSGGSGTYVNATASEGTVTVSSPGVYTYTAPASTSSTFFSVTVTDSSGVSGSTAIALAGSASGATLCGGTYSTTIDGSLNGTLTLVEDTNGKVAGHFHMVDYYYPVVGSCSGGQLNLRELVNGNIYVAAIAQNGAQVALTGTLTAADGKNYSWTAVSQTLNPLGTPPISCEGNFIVVIDSKPGTMILVQDGDGKVAGYLLLQGYYYALGGTLSGTTVSLTNFTTGSIYTGSVTVSGSAVAISGTFTTSGGTQYNWSAQSQ